MKKLRCLLVDDEPLAHTILENYIGRLAALEVAGHCYSAFEAINFLSKESVDLLFLDIEMPGLNGTGLLNALTNKPPVIMTTAYREFAAESYDYEVADYLLKPYSFERFVRAIQRVQKQIPPATPVSNAAENTFISQAEQAVFIKSDNESIRLMPGELLFVEGLKEYLKLHKNNGAIVIKSNFKQVEELFPAGCLLRIHKSFLVSVQHIERIRGNELKIGAAWLPIGRSYKMQVQDFLSRQLYQS